MARLTLTLLGPFTVALDGQSLNLRSARIRALLAYLALEPPRADAGEALAALFWPDEPDQAARQNLRQALYQLRGLLGELAEPFLLVASDTVQRNAACDYALDVALFLEHVKQGRASEAVALYQAELLTDLRSDSAPFEEWLALRREQLHILALDALHQLAEQALERGEAAHAQEYARRQLALEPWRELAHRQLMRALAADDRSAALAQFETCRAVLQSEFGAEPEPETSALAEQIRVGTPAQAMTPRSSAQRPHNAQRRDWVDILEGGTFYGRAHELAQLQHWITGERCRLVAVLGMGGLGKTTLAAQGARHCADHFAVVIWRSLLNAPSLAELLADWLSLLFDHQLAHIPPSLDAQLALLFEALRERRCLLVLDNAENITVQLWDTQTGASLATLTGHTAAIISLASSADGRWLFSGSDDQTVRVWDLSPAWAGNPGHVQTMRTLHGHYGTVRSLAVWRQPGTGEALLVSGSYDKTVRLWGVQGGQTLAILRGHAKWLQALIFTPADAPLPDRLLVAGSDGQNVRLWDGETGRSAPTNLV